MLFLPQVLSGRIGYTLTTTSNDKTEPLTVLKILQMNCGARKRSGTGREREKKREIIRIVP